MITMTLLHLQHSDADLASLQASTIYVANDVLQTYHSPLSSLGRPSSPISQGGRPLFSSPPTHVPTSEIDLSSPLTYGTPASRIGGTPARSGGTPIRPRSDIGGQRRLREVNLNATDPPVSP